MIASPAVLFFVIAQIIFYKYHDKKLEHSAHGEIINKWCTYPAFLLQTISVILWILIGLMLLMFWMVCNEPDCTCGGTGDCTVKNGVVETSGEECGEVELIPCPGIANIALLMWTVVKNIKKLHEARLKINVYPITYSENYMFVALLEHGLPLKMVESFKKFHKVKVDESQPNEKNEEMNSFLNAQ